MKRKIIELIMKSKVRIERGRSWFGFIRDIFILTSLLLGLIKLVFVFDMTFNLIISITLGFAIFLTIIQYVIGYLDEKKFLWKLEKDYQTEELTPFFKELKRKIDDIHERIQKI